MQAHGGLGAVRAATTASSIAARRIGSAGSGARTAARAAAAELVQPGRQVVEPGARLVGARGDRFDDRHQAGGGIGLHGAPILPQQAPSIVVCMTPFWIWTQAAIVVCVLVAMVIAIVKLA